MCIYGLIILEKLITGGSTVAQQWKSIRIEQKNNGMTDVEITVVAMLLNAFPKTIQQNLANSKANSFDRALWKILDGALRKCNKYEGNKLYRAETIDNIKKYKKGETITHPYYLTTTSDEQVAKNVAKTTFIWEIKTMGKNSKAVILPNLYRYGESQVEFPRGTKFKVIDIINANQNVPILKVKELP